MTDPVAHSLISAPQAPGESVEANWSVEIIAPPGLETALAEELRHLTNEPISDRPFGASADLPVEAVYRILADSLIAGRVYLPSHAAGPLRPTSSTPWPTRSTGQRTFVPATACRSPRPAATRRSGTRALSPRG